jgi:hypothetical protein
VLNLRKTAIGICILLIFTPNIFATNLRVPLMEIITRGELDGGDFRLFTRGNVDIEIEGGYKFGGRLNLALSSDDLGYTPPGSVDATSNAPEIGAYLENQSVLSFKSVEITVRDLFGSPLDLTFFSGLGEKFANGDLYPNLFGTANFSTKLRGYVSFPDSVKYDGLYQPAGTGLLLSIPAGPNVLTQIFTYQDDYINETTYSTDIRAIFNSPNIKLEGFIGASYPLAMFGVYRAGVMFFASPGDAASIFIQLGIPYFDSSNLEFGLDQLFFLFEPRFTIGYVSLVFTLFTRPAYYNQQETNESGTGNFSFDFQIGKPEQSPVTGGVQSSLEFQTDVGNQFEVGVSPYLSLISEGVVWDIKVNTKVWPFNVSELVEVFLGIRAEF